MESSHKTNCEAQLIARIRTFLALHYFPPLAHLQTPPGTAGPPRPHIPNTKFHTSHLSCVRKLLEAQLTTRVAELLVVLIRLEEGLALLWYSTAAVEGGGDKRERSNCRTIMSLTVPLFAKELSASSPLCLPPPPIRSILPPLPAPPAALPITLR